MLGRASSEPRNSQPLHGERLSERRRNRRRRSRIAVIVLLVLVIGLIVYGLRQSPVRISHVEIMGADASLATYATNAMLGNYFGIIPRDSILFFPEERIRSEILAADSYIAAVSISRRAFTGLSIKVDMRVPIARWCGLSQAAVVEEYCYVFDASGLIFSAVSSTTPSINTFRLYAPLVGDASEPLGATILYIETIPTIFDLARKLTTLGSPVRAIVIKDGEVNNYLDSRTRITYVLGKESEAFTALISAREQLNLTDGSIEYVDLRFDGKVYLKKKQAESSRQ